MITYHVEQFAGAYEEAKPLIFAHWEEIALNKDSIALNPDVEAYQNLEDQGRLHIYTARKGENLCAQRRDLCRPRISQRLYRLAFN